MFKGINLGLFFWQNSVIFGSLIRMTSQTTRNTMASQTTSNSPVCWQKHQTNKTSKFLHYWLFVMEIHLWWVYPPNKGPVMQKYFSCHNIIMDAAHTYSGSMGSLNVAYHVDRGKQYYMDRINGPLDELSGTEIKIQHFSFKKIHLRLLSTKCWTFFLAY